MRVRKTVLSLVLVGMVGLSGLTGPGPATAADVPAGSTVASQPAGGTPHVLDGRVWSVAQVGDTVILGGEFSEARNEGSEQVLPRANLLAFDRVTGEISESFLPEADGDVHVVIPAGDGETAYVGGKFRTIGGVDRKKIARVRLSDGSVVPTFDPAGPNGLVKDLKLVNGRLWVAGAFSRIDNQDRAGLATLDPATGRIDDFSTLSVAGTHNGGTTNVMRMDVTRDGSTLVGIGNFTSIGGAARRQLFMLDLSGASAQVAPWRTDYYTESCARVFDSYMRDIDLAPNGDFFVIGTTGAYRGSGSACDSIVRFETAAQGTDIAPTWVENTGGDTTWAVETTNEVVYTGGHARWHNNPFAADRAGAGAVARKGISALDAVNGLPLSWDPGRKRGIGVFDFLRTSDGLWVASDTDRIGPWFYKGRIALMPVGGESWPASRMPELPSNVYDASAQDLSSRSFDGATFGTASGAPGGSFDPATIRGAFMLNGWLYLAHADGSFTRRTFDGTEYGDPVQVDTHDQIVPLTEWAGDVANARSMWVDSGNLYFTRSGSAHEGKLYYRAFTPSSDVVGARRFVAMSSSPAQGVDFDDFRGAFVADDRLHWATPAGELRSLAWSHEIGSALELSGQAQVVSGPATDGIDWSGRTALFVDQQPSGAEPPPTPTAAFDEECTGLTCAFDGGDSSIEGGATLSYAWDFGDGEHGVGVRPTHSYDGPGSYDVELTVTSPTGATATTAHAVEVSELGMTFVDSRTTNNGRSKHSVKIPESVGAGDRLVLFLTLGSSNATITTPPAGWTSLETAEAQGFAGQVWTKTADSNDPGTRARVVTDRSVKSDMALTAYRSTSATPVVVQDSAGEAVRGAFTEFTTPVADAASPSWVVSYWAAKSSDTVTWSLPAGVETRAGRVGSGPGNISAAVADSGQPRPAGPVGGLMATPAPEVNKVAMFTVVLSTS